MSDIDLRIDELVLHGFPPGDRARLGAAVARELQRLYAAQPGERGGARDVREARVVAEPFTVAALATPERIGSQVARAVYQSLKP